MVRDKILPGITAILPAYNEEASIGAVVLRTRKYADRVVVIDDGSSDRTSEVAALAGAVVLRHAKNEGKGAALNWPQDATLDLILRIRKGCISMNPNINFFKISNYNEAVCL